MMSPGRTPAWARGVHYCSPTDCKMNRRDLEGMRKHVHIVRAFALGLTHTRTKEYQITYLQPIDSWIMI